MTGTSRTSRHGALGPRLAPAGQQHDAPGRPARPAEHQRRPVLVRCHPDAWPPRDPLGEALHALRVDGAFSCRSDLTADRGLAPPPTPGRLWLHVVTAGAGLLEVGDERRWRHPGEVVLGRGAAVAAAPA